MTESHKKLTETIAADVENFLAAGGKIQVIPGFENVAPMRPAADYDPAAVTADGEELLSAKTIMRRYGATKYDIANRLPKPKHKIQNHLYIKGIRMLNAWPKSVADAVFLDAGSARYTSNCMTASGASEYWGLKKSEIMDKVQRGILPPFDGKDPTHFWLRKTWNEIPLHEHIKTDPEEIPDGVPIKNIAAEFGINTYVISKMIRQEIIPPPDGVMSTQGANGRWYTCNAYTAENAARVRSIIRRTRG